MNFLVLVIALPTGNAPVRMRTWRAIKNSGAGVLRDGVYLLPNRESCRASFDAAAADVQSVGGTIFLMSVDNLNGANVESLFNRDENYAALLRNSDKIRNELTVADNTLAIFKQIRKLRKSYTSIVDIDFYPGEMQKQAEAALIELELMANRLLMPDEPHPVDALIPSLQIGDYQGRIWATRQRPWVDRLACAWLIRRFIDPEACFLWLDSPSACPTHAIGFDFDGASFSHAGSRVTFEVLLASFGLDHPALKRMGALIHYLDAGGIQQPEAIGIESVLAGLRGTISDDDQLLISAGIVFDGLLAAFNTLTKREQLQ